MKKYAKKATALAMAAAMAVMATPVHASAVNNAQQSTNVSDISTATDVTGDNTVVAPVYKVTLPTSLPFAIDAFQLLDPVNALASKDFAIVNRSNVPVSVHATFSVSTANEDIEAVDPSTGVKDTTPTTGNFKEVELTLQHASANKGGIIDATKTEPKWTYHATTTELSGQAADIELDFLLDNATYNADQKTISSAANAVLPEFNAAGFKIVGDVSAYPKLSDGTAAPWEAGDVTIAATFEIAGQRTTDYFDIEAESVGNAIGAAATRTYSALEEGDGTLPAFMGITATTLASISADTADTVITVKKNSAANLDNVRYYKLFSTTKNASAPAAIADFGGSYRSAIAEGTAVTDWKVAPLSGGSDVTIPIVDANGDPVTGATTDKYYVAFVDVNAKGQIVDFGLCTLEIAS